MAKPNETTKHGIVDALVANVVVFVLIKTWVYITSCQPSKKNDEIMHRRRLDRSELLE